MLPKNHRLKSKEDFDLVKKSGRMFPSESFGLLVVKTENEFKSGIIVSKKVFKRAVDRNKAKRAINRILTNYLPQIKTHFKIIFLVKKNILDKEDEDLDREIKNTFKKSGIL